MCRDNGIGSLSLHANTGRSFVAELVCSNKGFRCVRRFRLWNQRLYCEQRSLVFDIGDVACVFSIGIVADVCNVADLVCSIGIVAVSCAKYTAWRS